MARLALLAFPLLGVWAAGRRAVSTAGWGRAAWATLAVAVALQLPMALAVNSVPPPPHPEIGHGCVRPGAFLPMAAGTTLGSADEALAALGVAAATLGVAFLARRESRVPGALTVLAAAVVFVAFVAAMIVSGCPEL